MANNNKDGCLYNEDLIDLTSESDRQDNTHDDSTLLLDTEKPVDESSSLINKTFSNSALKNPVLTGQMNNEVLLKSKMPPNTNRVTEFGYSDTSRSPIQKEVPATKKKTLVLLSRAPSPKGLNQSVNIGVSDIVLTASPAEVINKKFPLSPTKKSPANRVNNDDEDVIFMSTKKLKVRPRLKTFQWVKAPLPKPVSQPVTFPSVPKRQAASLNVPKTAAQAVATTSVGTSSNTQAETAKKPVSATLPTQPTIRKSIQSQQKQPFNLVKGAANLHNLNPAPKAKLPGEATKSLHEAPNSGGVGLKKAGAAQSSVNKLVQNPFSRKIKVKPSTSDNDLFCFSHNGERKTYRKNASDQLEYTHVVRVEEAQKKDSVEPGEDHSQEKSSPGIANANFNRETLQHAKSILRELIDRPVEAGKSNISSAPVTKSAVLGPTSSAQSKNVEAEENAPIILNETVSRNAKKIQGNSQPSLKLKTVSLGPEEQRPASVAYVRQVFSEPKKDTSKISKLLQNMRPIQGVLVPQKYSIQPRKNGPVIKRINSESHPRDTAGISLSPKTRIISIEPSKASQVSIVEPTNPVEEIVSDGPDLLEYSHCIESEATDEAPPPVKNFKATREDPLKPIVTIQASSKKSATLPSTSANSSRLLLRNPLNGEIVRNKELQNYDSGGSIVNLTDLAETVSAVANINGGCPEGVKKNPVIYLVYPLNKETGTMAPFKEGQLQQIVALLPTASGLRQLSVVDKSKPEFGSSDFPLLPMATSVKEKTHEPPPLVPIQESQPVPPMVTPKVESSQETEDDDVILITDDDTEEVTPEIEIEPAAVVTPVDITSIINGFKKPFPKGRCVYNKVQRKSSKQDFKGFTRQEQVQPSCLKEMKSMTKKYTTTARKQRQEFLLKYISNIIYCTSDESGFLPELTKTEIKEEIEEIEVITINDDDENDSDILPTLGEVISQVNREVLDLQQPQVPRNNGELPPQALALIKKGLEMIQNWSNETGTSQTLENIIRDRLEQPAETKRKYKTSRATGSNKLEVVVQNTTKTVKMRGRPRKNKNQLPTVTVKRPRAIKRSRTKLDDCDDDLLVVKRVDILGGKKRGRKPKKL